MDRIGYAIVGSTGAIGPVHIDAIKRLDNCRLIGVYARTQEPLRQQAHQLGVKSYASLDEVLSDPEVDAIIIATPHVSHEAMVLEAASAGKHILVEKPMAVTVSEAESMVRAARSAGVKLGVLFNQRFRPESQRMRALIDEGAIGEIYRTSLVSAAMRTQDYYDRLDWRGTWEDEGGGLLLNQGIHGIDFFQWLGGMPKAVYGMERTLKHVMEAEDYASALFEYESGHGTVHCNTVQAPNQMRIELWGEKGALILDNGELTLHRLETPIQEFIDTDKQTRFAAPGSTTETFTFEQPGNSHVAAIGEFADALLEGREPAITGEEGVKSQELVAAITLSACRNKKVQLPIDRDEYDALLKRLRRLHKLPNE